MTTAQRQLLDKFADGDRPLCRAIAAALHDLDRARAAAPVPVPCELCDGTGKVVDPNDQLIRCFECGGDGRARP